MHLPKNRLDLFKYVLVVLVLLILSYNVAIFRIFNFLKYFNAEIKSLSVNKTEASSSKHLALNSTTKPVVIEDFSKELSKFKRIIQHNCSPREFKIEREKCINEILKFDEHLINPNRTNKVLNESEGCDKCFYALNNEKKFVYYHTFWQIHETETERFRLIKLNLISYLATQNLCCTKFILWKLDEFPQSMHQRLNKTFSYYIKNGVLELKTFRIGDYCERGFFKRGVCNATHSLNAKYRVSLSDLVRFVVLDHYGGIYTDGDTIYLKDMRFFWYFNFSYRWTFLNAYNTAVLGIHKHYNSSLDQFYRVVFAEAATLDDIIHSLHPQSMSHTISRLNRNNGSIYDYEPLLALHSHFFDGAWLCHDGPVRRFTPSSVCQFIEFSTRDLLNGSTFDPSEFYRGAFAYHIHYKVDVPVSNSYFRLFEEYFQSYVTNLDLNE